MNISKELPKKIYIVACLFFLIFLPPLLRISMTYIMMAMMIIVIATHILINNYVELNANCGLKLLAGFLPFIIYIFIRMIVNVLKNNSVELHKAYLYNFTHILVSFLYVIVCYLFLTIIILKKNNYNEMDWIKLLVIASLIQVFFIFISYLSSDLHNIFISLYLKNNKNEINLGIVSVNRWRAYGLSGYYFDNLAFILSGTSLISIIKALDSKKNIYYLLGLLIALASVLGARTSLVLVVSGFVIAFIYFARKRGVLFVLQWLLIIIASVFLILLFLTILSEGIREWLKIGWNAIVSVITDGSKNSAFGEILGNDLVFPKDWFFGIGAQPEALNYYDSFHNYIDNGYVQVIWRFGLFGFLLLFFGVVRFYIIIFRGTKDSFTRGLTLVLSLVLGLYFVKYYPLSTYGGHVIYFVVPAVLYTLIKKKENEYVWS